jgi:hypothetical protein
MGNTTEVTKTALDSISGRAKREFDRVGPHVRRWCECAASNQLPGIDGRRLAGAELRTVMLDQIQRQ